MSQEAARLEFSYLSRTVSNVRTDEITIGPGYWFIKDYFLYLKLAWTTLIIHVGDVKADQSKPLQLTIQIPIADELAERQAANGR